MAKINIGGQVYDTDFFPDHQAIIDKIKAAQAGQDVKGIQIVSLPKPEPEPESSGSSLTTFALLGALGYLVLKR